MRYRTADFNRLDDETARCGCGRAFPLVAAVKGRGDDVVKLPDGRHTGRIDHIFKGVGGILKSQIRQEQIDRIDVFEMAGAGDGPGAES